MKYLALVIAILMVSCSDNHTNNQNLNMAGKAVIIGNPVNKSDSVVTVMIQYKELRGYQVINRIKPAIIPATVKINHGDSVTFIRNKSGYRIISVWKPAPN